MLQLLAFLVFSSPAHADLACPMVAALSFKPETCDDNEKMGDAALDCVQSYHEHIKAAQADVLKKFQEQIARLKEQQSDTFDRTQAGYADARKQLDALIAEGKVARAAVDDLQANLVYPEDYDEPETTGMSTKKYLATTKCYAIPFRVTRQSQMMIDKMMNDLIATEEAALGKQNSSHTRSNHVQAVEGNKAITHGKGVGVGKVGSGKSRNPASDITGVKPDADPLPK